MSILKKGILAAAAILSIVSLAACGTETVSGNGTNDTDKTEEVGTMLTLTAMDENMQTIVNDAGMNGTGGRIHLHSNRPEDMYKGSGSRFVFDIGHIEKIGELYIWNYNVAEDTASGVKEVTISISEDNRTWTEVETCTLAQADGEDGSYATNKEDGTPIDFHGISARYLCLEAKSNYGGDGYGLSELRLFRYKQPIIVGESISCSPLERYINNKWSATPEDYNFVNGTGLSDFRSAEAVHDNLPAHMFAQEAKAFEFTIDLQGEYPVSRLAIWNYNDPEHLDYGLKEFRLKVSDDYATWKTIGTYTLPQADGSDKLAASLVIDLEESVQAHYIQLEILGNYGGEKVGLSEVSVFLGSGWYCDEVSDYTALFSRYEGWAGADGIYSVNLDGKDYDYDSDASEEKTFFVFSDTIVSDVDPVTKIRSNFYMPNNTSALLTGKAVDCKKITFRWPGKEEATAGIVPDPVTPATKPGKSIYYWLGDTFVIGEHLYVYCLRIDSVNTAFGFEQIGVDLARYDIVDGEVDYDSLKLVNDGDMRLCDVSDSSTKWYLGGAVYQSTEDAGVMDPDGFVYVYGYQDVLNVGRVLIVSRVKPEDVEDFSKYEYLDENGNWVTDTPKLFKALADDVAPECSVTQIQSGENKGKFLFVNTHITNTPTIKASVSEASYEVFENKTTVYSHDTCLTTLGKGNNSYNAKAHPVLSTADEIIISYNVNGDDAFEYADIYRPRFLRLAMVAER